MDEDLESLIIAMDKVARSEAKLRSLAGKTGHGEPGYDGECPCEAAVVEAAVVEAAVVEAAVVGFQSVLQPQLTNAH